MGGAKLRFPLSSGVFFSLPPMARHRLSCAAAAVEVAAVWLLGCTRYTVIVPRHSGKERRPC